MLPMRSYSDFCLESHPNRLSNESLDRMSEGACVAYANSCASSGVSGSSAASMVSADDAIRRLEEELEDARRALLEKEDKCVKLSSMQSTVDSEVQELTEKLFQEAYKMVNAAEERREKAEKLLSECRMKVDVLQAEVEALKLIVKTPGAGANHHAHNSPQHKPALFKFLNSSSTSMKKGASISSSITFPNAKKSSSLPSTTKELKQINEEQQQADDVQEIDPLYYREFTEWRDLSHPLDNAPFLNRISEEDVQPCMNFDNKMLSDRILAAIQSNTMEIEPVNEEKPMVKTCSLTRVPRFCPYRVRTDSEGQWNSVSILARNRIAAVCDYYTYLRYLNLGIVKSGVRECYFDIIALRKNMSLVRLGLGFVPKTTLHRPGSGFC